MCVPASYPCQKICLTVVDEKQHKNIKQSFHAALEICINLVEKFSGKKVNHKVSSLQFR